MSAVGNFLLQHQFHQFLGGWGHIFEALSERNDREAHALKVLHHLHSTPAVESNFPNIEPLTQAFDEFLDVAVVNDIALGGLQISLPLPHVVWHVVAPDSEFQVVFRYPEVRQDDVFVILIFRREHKHECRNVRCRGQVQTAVTDTAFQIVLADGELTFVPLVHRHPAHRLFHPLVKSQLSEGVLFAWVLLGGLAGVFDLVDTHRDAEGRIGFLPDLRVRPIVRFLRTVDDRIEGVVNLAPLDDVLCLPVDLIADGLRIVAGRGDEEIQRLHTGIAGALGHNIKELAVWLGVQLIEHHAVGIKSVFVAHIGGEHLVDTARRLINEPLLGIQYLDPLRECRTHPHHISRHIEHDGRLLTVGGAAVHLGALLAVTAGEQKCHRSGKLGLAMLFRNFDVCRVELPIAVGLEDTENVPDNLLLPVDELERLSRPGAFGVTQTFDEHDGIIRCVHIVVGGFLHEPCGLVVFQFSRCPHLQGIKIAATEIGATFHITSSSPSRSCCFELLWLTSSRCGAEAPLPAGCFHRRVQCPSPCRSCRRFCRLA